MTHVRNISCIAMGSGFIGLGASLVLHCLDSLPIFFTAACGAPICFLCGWLFFKTVRYQ